MSSFAHWVRAARPKTLPAAVVPVALGSACAYAAGGFAVVPALIALAFALQVQVLTNLANDYYDFKKGADTAERIGPVRVTAAGLVPPAAMARAVAIVALTAFLTGLGLLPYGGWPLLVVGLASLAGAVGYTAGPLPLAYLGLGDIFVVVFFGFVAVPFTTFTQCGRFPAFVWPAALGCGLLANAILITNNARDIATDAKAGKRTTAVRFGVGFAKLQYALTMLAGLAMPMVLAVAYGFRWPVLVSLIVCPFAGGVVRRFCAVEDARDFNPLLGKTAAVLLAWGALFAAGIAAGKP